MKLLRTIASLFLLASVCAVSADGGVKVLALFPGKAMLAIDGHNRLLKRGQRSPEGIKLISADSREAVIERDGQRSRLALGNHIGSTYAARASAEARIWRDRNRGYTTYGAINGQRVKMLLDTGATAVAMSETQAARLDLDYRKGQTLSVSTASGTARGWEVHLNRVRVGDIQLYNVRAIVLEGNSPRHVLLGMSFLSRVKMDERGEMLVLQAKL
ncbi:MAG TPA: TIGR02281 family clan AA aspartic protease [Chromatiales bacterium]|nr:TIGR02281 family clan AA aspartic protease [Chromatiales bacterium]